MNKPRMDVKPRVDPDALTAAMVMLARCGIEPDIQELLVNGDPSREIPPGAFVHALDAAIDVIIRNNTQEEDSDE